MTNLNKYKEELKKLIDTAKLMSDDLHYRTYTVDKIKKLKPEKQELIKKNEGLFERRYQSWYTEASAVIKQLIPDRLAEFNGLYTENEKRADVNLLNFTIQDWLKGMRSINKPQTKEKVFDDLSTILMRFKTQKQILSSAKLRFLSSLMDIRQLLQADFFDSEIDVSKELIKKGFYRAAGVICGVIIEKHLAQVCSNHSVIISKKFPTISDFNDNLKLQGIVDIPIWRSIQRLGDLRNLCGHNKEKEPTKEDVEELVNGTDKLIKTLF